MVFKGQKEKFATIQSELEKAFQKILHKKVVVHPAGRTDAKVHALGQVIHIQIPSNFLEKKLLFENNQFIKYINSILPNDIKILEYQKVPNSFHARYSCISREYKYIIYNNPISPCFFGEYLLWIKKPLDIQAMKKSAKYLIGEK